MTDQSDQVSGKRRPAQLSRAQRFERWTETFSAILLGLVTIATAWSGYQAARWSGEQSALFTDALSLMIDSTRTATEANQLTLLDITLFLNYTNAYSAGNEELATFYYERFRPEARLAVDAWLATRPRTNPEAPPGPFQMPEYRVSQAEQAAQLEEQAANLFEQGKVADEHSDDYVLNAVLLASVLFLAGIAPRFDWQPLVIIILVVAVILLVFGLYNLSTLPIQ